MGIRCSKHHRRGQQSSTNKPRSDWKEPAKAKHVSTCIHMELQDQGKVPPVDDDDDKRIGPIVILWRAKFPTRVVDGYAISVAVGPESKFVDCSGHEWRKVLHFLKSHGSGSERRVRVRVDSYHRGYGWRANQTTSIVDFPKVPLHQCLLLWAEKIQGLSGETVQTCQVPILLRKGTNERYDIAVCSMAGTLIYNVEVKLQEVVTYDLMRLMSSSSSRERTTTTTTAAATPVHTSNRDNSSGDPKKRPSQRRKRNKETNRAKEKEIPVSIVVPKINIPAATKHTGQDSNASRETKKKRRSQSARTPRRGSGLKYSRKAGSKSARGSPKKVVRWYDRETQSDTRLFLQKPERPVPPRPNSRPFANQRERLMDVLLKSQERKSKTQSLEVAKESHEATEVVLISRSRSENPLLTDSPLQTHQEEKEGTWTFNSSTTNYQPTNSYSAPPSPHHHQNTRDQTFPRREKWEMERRKRLDVEAKLNQLEQEAKLAKEQEKLTIQEQRRKLVEASKQRDSTKRKKKKKKKKGGSVKRIKKRMSRTLSFKDEKQEQHHGPENKAQHPLKSELYSEGGKEYLRVFVFDGPYADIAIAPKGSNHRPHQILKSLREKIGPPDEAGERSKWILLQCVSSPSPGGKDSFYRRIDRKCDVVEIVKSWEPDEFRKIVYGPKHLTKKQQKRPASKE